MVKAGYNYRITAQNCNLNIAFKDQAVTLQTLTMAKQTDNA